MSKSFKGLMLGAFVAALMMMGAGAQANHLSAHAEHATDIDLGPGLNTANRATGGGLEAAAVGELGDTTFDESTAVPIMDLPALEAEQDAQGRIRMDLPGLTLVGPGKKPAPAPAPGPGAKLPVTGVNAGDLFALGLAALSGGGVLVRRLRLAFAS